MINGAQDLRIRLSDQKNGAYRVESAEWYSGERDGVALGQCDFVEDIVSCALAQLGATGNAALWSGAATALDEITTVIAWIV